jgi:hypothetical protein
VLGLPPLHRHLRFDFVDLLHRLRALVRFGRQAALKKGRSGRRSLGTGHFAAPQLAQHLEFALSHKIVALLAFDQFLEHLATVAAIAHRLRLVEIGPIRRRIANESNDFRQQSPRIVFGHDASVSRYSKSRAGVFLSPRTSSV